VHPLVQKFWTKPQQIRWFLVSGVIAFASGVYALFYTDFSPVVIGLFAFGALMLLFYTWPLKYLGVGELSIFLIWGPVLIAGIYTVLAKGWTDNTWLVALAAVPFGLSVVSINIGKHIDKMDADKAKGVGTMPVRLGEKFSRYVNMASLVLIYLVIIYLVFVPQYFTPVMLIVLLAGKRLLLALKTLSKPRPAEAPEGYAYWPTWFAAVCFYHNRMFGGLLILGLIADALLRVFAPGFWPWG
jgi:1,4-dihydroxy-2-naphthoate octaprenyltransferase